MKKFKQLTKRGFALFIALMMCVSVMQLTAFATESDPDSGDAVITDDSNNPEICETCHEDPCVCEKDDPQICETCNEDPCICKKEGASEGSESGENIPVEDPAVTMFMAAMAAMNDDSNPYDLLALYDALTDGQKAELGSEIAETMEILRTPVNPLAENEGTSDVVAMIGETGYATLQAAINVAKPGDTVTLAKAVAENVTVEENMTVTLDLNGMIWRGVPQEGGATAIFNKGTLTIMDSKDSKDSGMIVSSEGNAIVNEGTLDVTSGTIQGGGDGINARPTSVTNIHGTAKLSGGSSGSSGLFANNSFPDDRIKINVYGNAQLCTEDGIGLAASGAMTHVYGNAQIKGATGIVTYGKLIVEGDVTITSDDNNAGIAVYEHADVEVKGGTITSIAPIIDDDPLRADPRTVVVTGGTFGADPTGTYFVDVAEGYKASKKDGKWEIVSTFVAQVLGGNKYETLAEAIEAAQDGGTVVLLADVETNAFIDVNKSITIEGDNHKVTSTANRILRVTVSDVTVTLNDIEFISTTAERGVQVDIGMTGVELNVNNCTVPATYYAVNICSDTSVALNIADSTISGWGALNLWGDNYEVNVTNSTLIGHNDKSYDAAGWNGFGVIVLEGDTTGKTDEHVSGCHVVLEDCHIKASTAANADGTGNIQKAILFNSQSTNNKVEIIGDKTVVEYTQGELTPFCKQSGTNNELTVSAGTYSDDVTDYCVDGYKAKDNGDGTWTVVPMEYVAQVGETRYEDLQEAIKVANQNLTDKTVTLLADVTVETWDQTWNVSNVTIDGDGHTLTVNTVVSGGNGDYLLYSAENLTIKDLTVEITNGNAFNVANSTLENVKIIGGTWGVVTNGNVQITECTFDGQTEMAIYTDDTIGAPGMVVDGCTFNNTRIAILRANETVKNCTATGTRPYYQLTNVGTETTITGNTFSAPLELFGQPGEITKNDFSDMSGYDDGTMFVGSLVAGQTVTVDLSYNFWGGGAPADLEGMIVDTWYTTDEMKDEITLSPASPSLNVGGTATLTVGGPLAGKVTIWTSSNESVATVDANGVVTAVANGTATITATVGISPRATASATCTVTVSTVEPGTPVTPFIPFTPDIPSTPSSSNNTPNPPAVEIADNDVPLVGGAALNKADHFAYITGYQDGTVRPEQYITREEVAMIFYRLLTDLSRAMYETTDNSFSDVASNRWSNTAISTLVNAGILTGYQDGTFLPGRNITRAEFAAISARFEDVEEGLDNPFSDTVGHWAEDVISFSHKRGWVNGYEDGTFRPQQNITRAEVMKWINQVLERSVNAEGLIDGVVCPSDNLVSKWYFYEVLEAINGHEFIREANAIIEKWTSLR